MQSVTEGGSLCFFGWLNWITNGQVKAIPGVLHVPSMFFRKAWAPEVSNSVWWLVLGSWLWHEQGVLLQLLQIAQCGGLAVDAAESWHWHFSHFRCTWVLRFLHRQTCHRIMGTLSLHSLLFCLSLLCYLHVDQDLTPAKKGSPERIRLALGPNLLGFNHSTMGVSRWKGAGLLWSPYFAFWCPSPL